MNVEATYICDNCGEDDQYQPDVIVGRSRGGAVAMNIESKDTPLVLTLPGLEELGNG